MADVFRAFSSSERCYGHGYDLCFWLNLSDSLGMKGAEGLQKAAQNFRAIMPQVVAIAGEIVTATPRYFPT